MSPKLNLIIFLILNLVYLNFASDDTTIYSNGYGDGISTGPLYNDGTVEEIISTNSPGICAPGMEKCLETVIIDQNGFYSFQGESAFSSNDCRYIEFYMRIEITNSTAVPYTPLIWTSIETVSTPKRVYLNSTVYVGQNGEESESVDLTDWSFVRIKITDLNVHEKTFNTFKLGSNYSNVNIYFGDASFEDAPTSLYPKGSINSSSLLSPSLFLFTLTLLLSLLSFF